jgi:hypothetical protein
MLQQNFPTTRVACYLEPRHKDRHVIVWPETAQPVLVLHWIGASDPEEKTVSGNLSFTSYARNSGPLIAALLLAPLAIALVVFLLGAAVLRRRRVPTLVAEVLPAEMVLASVNQAFDEQPTKSWAPLVKEKMERFHLQLLDMLGRQPTRKTIRSALAYLGGKEDLERLKDLEQLTAKVKGILNSYLQIAETAGDLELLPLNQEVKRDRLGDERDQIRSKQRMRQYEEKAAELDLQEKQANIERVRKRTEHDPGDFDRPAKDSKEED